MTCRTSATYAFSGIAHVNIHVDVCVDANVKIILSSPFMSVCLYLIPLPSFIGPGLSATMSNSQESAGVISPLNLFFADT